MVYFRKILITTDMSEFSLAAMEYAASVGLLYAAKLRLLHVLEHTPGGMKRLGLEDDGKAEERLAEQETARELREFVAQKVGPHIPLVPVVRSGSPAEMITQYAKEEGMDLIVMATHGRTGLRHILMGSVAEKVVRTSDVPVLTVKPQVLREAILKREDIEIELHLP
jgi:nucleotide-binding universal stress UspA family protein